MFVEIWHVHIFENEISFVSTCYVMCHTLILFHCVKKNLNFVFACMKYFARICNLNKR